MIPSLSFSYAAGYTGRKTTPLQNRPQQQQPQPPPFQPQQQGIVPPAQNPFQNFTPIIPSLPGINTSGANPYLSDPLMSSYYGMESPYYQPQQQDFYGDPELFRPPSVTSGMGR